MLKYTEGVTKKNNKLKENVCILLILSVSIVLLFLIQDKSKYGILIHSIYAIFLISIGIILFNTMKFNRDRFISSSVVIFSFAGILEIIHIYMMLNVKNSIESLSSPSIILSIMTDVFPIIGIYLNFNLINKRKKIFNNLSIISISTVLVISLTIFFINSTGFLSLKFFESYNKFYLIELSVNLFIFIVLVIIYIKLKLNSNYLNFNEITFLMKILLILIFSRLPMLFNFEKNNIYLEDILSQIIMNLAMYYLYNYIIYNNIQKPYLKLSMVNEQLVEKAENLKDNNEKLIRETEKIQELKNMLTSKEAKLQSTLDVSVNSIVVFNKNREITYANKMFSYIFKYDKDNKDYKIDIDLRDKIKNYKELLKNIDYIFDKEVNTQDLIYTTHGKCYQAIFAPLMIKNNMEGVLCILIDKTKKKEFEEEINIANARYERFLESIGDGIVVLQDGKRTYVNKACKDIFKDELDKINFCIDDKKDNKEEMYIIDGKKVYVEMSFSEYTKNDQNKNIIVIRDITNRKMAQFRLKERQKSYAKFIDILPDGICLLDEDMNIDYVNQSLIDMLKIDSIDEIKYTNIKNIINLNLNEEKAFYIKMKKVLKESRYMILLENELISGEGKNIQVEVNALPFDIDENKYIMLIIKDLTNKKISEMAEKELLERLKTDKIKTEFFANMSHELKTPLNVISSSNQLVDSFYRNGKIEDYNDNIKSHIDLVRQSSYRLQRLINNIIDLTKMESGFYKLKLFEYNIVTVIEDLFMKVERYASKKNISIIFDTEMEEINMYLDKSEIERIILNLLSNCIKFTPSGGYIYVNIYKREENIVISVKDTGVGIPKDKLELIFEEFAQVDKTLSRNTEGSGIGLTIVKNLVELHNGKISVKSEENKGTEFIISFPIRKNEDEIHQEDRKIYNIDEKIKIEFSDIYY